MKTLHLYSRHLLILAVSVATAALTLPLHADTVDWTNWTTGTAGNPGTAKGTIGLGSGVGVSYSGQTNGLLAGYPSWTPASSFSGGTVGNAPPAANNSVQLTGGSSQVETITFTSAITNPVLAIWSLGQSGDQALFDFTSSEPFSVQAGGPSAEYGGSSITQSGNNVLGSEGNGVIQFNGTFSSLTFTNPNYEFYYAFTVGADAGPTAVTPEPESLYLLGSGLASLPLLLRSLRRKTRV